MFHSWNQAFRITGFLGWCPNINPAWWWEQGERWLIWPNYIFPVIRRPGFVIVTPPFPPFSAVFGNQSFGNCSSTMNVAFLKLSSSSRWIWSSAVTFAAGLLWFTDTILFNVRRSLSLSFCFQPPFLLVDDVLPWFVSVVIPLETAALDTPNKVAILVTDATPNFASTIWPLWKFEKSPFCSTFIQTVTKYNL